MGKKKGVKRFSQIGMFDRGWRTGSWAKCLGNCGRDCPGCNGGMTPLKSPGGYPWCLECWNRFEKDLSVDSQAFTEVEEAQKTNEDVLGELGIRRGHGNETA